jgi:hypothetical protein
MGAVVGPPDEVNRRKEVFALYRRSLVAGQGRGQDATCVRAGYYAVRRSCAREAQAAFAFFLVNQTFRKSQDWAQQR